jgi:hypothetical protein
MKTNCPQYPGAASYCNYLLHHSITSTICTSSVPSLHQRPYLTENDIATLNVSDTFSDTTSDPRDDDNRDPATSTDKDDDNDSGKDPNNRKSTRSHSKSSSPQAKRQVTGDKTISTAASSSTTHSKEHAQTIHTTNVNYPIGIKDEPTCDYAQTTTTDTIQDSRHKDSTTEPTVQPSAPEGHDPTTEPTVQPRIHTLPLSTDNTPDRPTIDAGRDTAATTSNMPAREIDNPQPKIDTPTN